MDSGSKETMDLSANSGVADTSSKTPAEEGQSTNVNANKEEIPSTEGSKNEEPTQVREVKDVCDSTVPVRKAEPVLAKTPVTTSSSPGTTPALPAPKTPESDCGSFCECDSPADSAGEVASPHKMERSKASTHSGLIAAEPCRTLPTAAPPSVPVPSEKVHEQTGPVGEPTPGGVLGEDKPTIVVPTEQITATSLPTEKLTATSLPTKQLTATSLPTEQLTPTSLPTEQLTAANEQLTPTSEQITATSGQLTATSEQITATSQVQEVTPTPPINQGETPPPATAQPTAVPTKEPPEDMHVEEAQPETCSAPDTTPTPVSKPSEDTTRITHPESATMDSNGGPETEPTLVPVQEPIPATPAPVQEPVPATPVPVQEPVPATPVPVQEPVPATPAPVQEPVPATPAPVQEPVPATPVPVQESVPETPAPVPEPLPATPAPAPTAVPTSEEVPAPTTEAAAAAPPESEPVPTPPSVTTSQPVVTPAPDTVSGTTEPKEPSPSPGPLPAPVTEATAPPVSNPGPITTPVPVTHEAPGGEPACVAVPAAGSSTEAVPVIAEDTEKPSDLSCAPSTPPEGAATASPPKTPKSEIVKEDNIEGQPVVPPGNDLKDKGEKPEEEAMEVDQVDQTVSVVKVDTKPKPQATALPNKLPTDAPPSMDDDSLSLGAHGDLKEATKTADAEEPMEMEEPLVVLPPGSSSEDSSKDAPPQDFKPFSHYTEDGKLIDKEERSTVNEPPVAADNAATDVLAATGESLSVDDSFPGGREELSESVKSQPGSSQPAEMSQFQGQFMDFLKCNDNATQHSFGVDDKPLASSSQGEATVGSEVTADGETTSQPTTPQAGKRRKRRTKAQMMADRAAAAAATGTNVNNDDASNASLADSQKGSRSARKRKQNEDDVKKDGASTDVSPSKDVLETFPPEKLFEYQWPQIDKNSDWFFLQEHLSAFLGVKSFKRKYPTLERRPVSMPERNFLQESGVVSEMMCDLGLTALKSDQVYELMLRDFAEKYQQYAEVLHEREQIRRSEEKNKIAADMASVTKNNVVDVRKKAVRSAAEFNAQFMRERREERKAYFDMQTCEIHYPKSTIKVLPPALTKVGGYPVALIPGQFSEYYKKYTPQQMKYFPLNTCMYDPPRQLKTIYADPADKYESELDSQSASSQGDGDDGSSSSGSSSGSGSDGDSDSSSDVEEKETPAPTPTPTPAPAPASNKKPTKTSRGKKQQQQQPPQPPAEEEPVPVKDAATMCNICQGTSEKNKIGEAEELVKCAECGRHGHPSCLELTIEMIPNIKTYPWQCMECKTCVECMDPYDEDKMMFCDHCDRGYHTFCVGLRSIPTGRWECPSCRPEQPPSKKRRRQAPQKLETAA